MENFFGPARIWKDGGPFPHVLVLLSEDDAFRAYARAHHDLLAEYGDKLGVIPEKWLHSTVQGIHHLVAADQMTHLCDSLRDELSGMPPFRVQLGPVWPGVTALTVAVYPEDGMAALNDRVRTAAEKVPGICLRAKESRFFAHATVAYARGAFPDQKLNRALRALRPPRVDLTVDRVHVVNMYQRPELGYYTWDVVEEIPFG